METEEERERGKIRRDRKGREKEYIGKDKKSNRRINMEDRILECDGSNK